MPGDDPADVAQIEEVGNSPSLGSDLVRGVAAVYGGEDQLEPITIPSDTGSPTNAA